MNEQVRLLQAEIQADLRAIEETYEALNYIGQRVVEPETCIMIPVHFIRLVVSFQDKRRSMRMS